MLIKTVYQGCHGYEEQDLGSMFSTLVQAVVGRVGCVMTRIEINNFCSTVQDICQNCTFDANSYATGDHPYKFCPVGML